MTAFFEAASVSIRNFFVIEQNFFRARKCQIQFFIVKCARQKQIVRVVLLIFPPLDTQTAIPYTKLKRLPSRSFRWRSRFLRFHKLLFIIRISNIPQNNPCCHQRHQNQRHSSHGPFSICSHNSQQGTVQKFTRCLTFSSFFST